MNYIILVVFCFVPLQASQPLPKETPAQMDIRMIQIRDGFKNKIQARSKARKIALYSILPTVLADLVHEYEWPYSPLWEKISVTGLIEGKHKYGLEPVIINAPLRFDLSDQSNYRLLFRDVFKAYVFLFHRHMSPKRWVQDITRFVMYASFNQYLAQYFNVVTYSLSQKDGVKCLGEASVCFPAIDYWPLAVYWQDETVVLTRINSQTKRHGALSTIDSSMNVACCSLLKVHHKIPVALQPQDLVLFCSACNGKIENPANTFRSLMLCHTLPQGSAYCTGEHILCRVYRPLRVFMKEAHDVVLEKQGRKRKRV